MLIFMPVGACVCNGEWESPVSNRHFHAVVPQTIAESASVFWHSRPTIALGLLPALDDLFLMRLSLRKQSFHFSVHRLRSCQSRRLMKRGPQPPVERFKNSYNRCSEKTILILWIPYSGYTIIGWDVCYVDFCLTLWICVLFTYQNMYIMLKI